MIRAGGTAGNMIIALTGTPGVGKTSVCACLKRMRFSSPLNIIDLNEIIRNRYHRGYDRKRHCFIADMRRLRTHVRGEHRRMMHNAQRDDPERSRRYRCVLLLDGHLSHLLRPDIAIVLRASPPELARRLIKKGFEPHKIDENVHAEVLDVILIEAVERCKVVYEIDTTDMCVEDVADVVHQIIETEIACASNNGMREICEMRERYAPGSVDWSGWDWSGWSGHDCGCAFQKFH